MTEPRDHWEAVHRGRAPTEVSWYQSDPALSSALIRSVVTDPAAAILDVGAGASFLVDRLLAEGFHDLTVLDISEAAIGRVRERLGDAGGSVEFICTDVTEWSPPRRYDLWHDRAVFHFLTDPRARAGYVRVLTSALRPGGHVVLATFSLDGPERCSGLPVQRYDEALMADTLGPSFQLTRVESEAHETPTGRIQHFQYFVLGYSGATVADATSPRGSASEREAK